MLIMNWLNNFFEMNLDFRCIHLEVTIFCRTGIVQQALSQYFACWWLGNNDADHAEKLITPQNITRILKFQVKDIWIQIVLLI